VLLGASETEQLARPVPQRASGAMRARTGRARCDAYSGVIQRWQIFTSSL
jgi:hypothetical protein